MAKTTLRPPRSGVSEAKRKGREVELKQWGLGPRPRSAPPNEFARQAALQAQAQEFKRIAEVVEAAGSAMAALAEKYDLTVPMQAALLKMLLGKLQNIDETGNPVPPLPDRAPELWSDREGRQENPPAFLRRVYAPWLGKGLTRAQLGSLDQPLYQALSVWEHRHPEDRLAELPTLTEVIDRKIAALATELTPDELRKLGSTLQTRLRREKK